MSAQKSIRKAVFPVAGLGSRFLPATKAQPKEMLPIVDKPLIQYAVEEAYEAGIRHMIFVTGRSKRAIEDHFDTAYELESELQAAGKSALLDLVRSVQPADMVCSYVRQSHALGLGHAVLCAEALVGDEPFAVLLADALMRGTPGGPGVRIDSHVYTGYEIPPFYDSLIGKLIVWGVDRDHALRRLRRALSECAITGIPTTIEFHLQLLDRPEFQAGDVHTKFVEQEMLPPA